MYKLPESSCHCGCSHEPHQSFSFCVTRLMTIVTLWIFCPYSPYFLTTRLNSSLLHRMKLHVLGFLAKEMTEVDLHDNPLLVDLVDRGLHTVRDSRVVVVRVCLPCLEVGNNGHLVHHNGSVDLDGAMVAFDDSVGEEEVLGNVRAVYRRSSAVVVDMEPKEVVVPVVHRASHEVDDRGPFHEEVGDREDILRACSVVVGRGVEMGVTYPKPCFFVTATAWFVIFLQFAQDGLRSNSLFRPLDLFVICCPSHRGFHPLRKTLFLMTFRVTFRSVFSSCHHQKCWDPRWEKIYLRLGASSIQK